MDRTINFDRNEYLQILFGKYDQNLRLIEQELDVMIIQDSKGLKISGKRIDVDKACELIDYLKGITENGSDVKERDIVYALKLAKPDEGVDFKELAKEKIDVSVKGTIITPKTKGQIE